MFSLLSPLLIFALYHLCLFLLYAFVSLILVLFCPTFWVFSIQMSHVPG